MKLECSTSELVEAVTRVSKAASPRSTLPVIEGMLMRAGRNGLYLCCYNLDMGITKNIDARVDEDGQVVVPLRFCDIVRHMPGDRVTIECNEKLIVSISSGDTVFEIVGMPTLEFPELPVVDDEHSFSVPENRLRTMITQTAHAISTRQERPIYTGALFEVESDTLRVITLDGYRVAVRTEEISSLETYDFIVPGRTLTEIGRLLRDCDEKAEIGVAKHNIVFIIDGYNVISRLMIGNFINYRTAFDFSTGMELSVKTSDILAGMERMAIVNTETNKSPVRCVFGGGKIRLQCETSVGRADSTVLCAADFEPVEIGFNNKYMMDAFRAADTDEVKIIISAANKTIRVLPPEGESFMFLLMPVVLNAARKSAE